jgi:hypothetical protein
MSHLFRGARAIVAAIAVVTLLPGLVRIDAQTATSRWRTAWGHPDLQGTWTTDAEILVPFERPAAYGERRVLSAEELATREAESQKRIADDKNNRRPGSDLGTPEHWFEIGNGLSNRTSFVVDPPNGRMPPLIPDAAARPIDPRLETGLMGGDGTEPMDGPEDTGLASRCITRGIPQTWVPSIYNNGFQILQTPDHVAIFYERYHEVRLIPLDGRPHAPKPIRQWIGDSRARWEGDTLVVDVTAFNGESWFDRAGNYQSDRLHVVERYTLMTPDALRYEVTIEDETLYTRPWKMSMPISRRLEKDARLVEYKCVEFVEELMYGDLVKRPAAAGR